MRQINLKKYIFGKITKKNNDICTFLTTKLKLKNIDSHTQQEPMIAITASDWRLKITSVKTRLVEVL